MKSGVLSPKESWEQERLELETIFSTPIFGNPSTKYMRKVWDEKLKSFGWQAGGAIPESKLLISYSRPPFGLCVQTGNVCRVHSDLLKLEALYKFGLLSAGFLAIPDDRWSKHLGSNHASYSKTERDLHSFRSVVTVPIFLIRITIDEGGAHEV
jgi:hypothetical protein